MTAKLALGLFFVGLALLLVNERWRYGHRSIWLSFETGMLLAGMFVLGYYRGSSPTTTRIGFAFTAISLFIGLVGVSVLSGRRGVRGFTKPLFPGLRKRKQPLREADIQPF